MRGGYILEHEDGNTNTGHAQHVPRVYIESTHHFGSQEVTAMGPANHLSTAIMRHSQWDSEIAVDLECTSWLVHLGRFGLVVLVPQLIASRHLRTQSLSNVLDNWQLP